MTTPTWLWELLGVNPLAEGTSAEVGGQTVLMREGLPRVGSLVSDAQAQTRDAFGFKWAKRDTSDFEGSLAPRLADRLTSEEERSWCRGIDLAIERGFEESAGITVVARKG